MHTETGLPETLTEAIKHFATGDNAWHLMVSMRWPKGVSCPTCGASDVRFIGTRKLWECKTKHPKKQFSVKVGTIFEDSPIKLETWFAAMWMLANCKNGVSSYEIMRELGVTQKTGWFMLQRIRLAMQAGSIVKGKMGSVTEVDESYIGGAARNMHKKVAKARRETGRMGTGGVGKTAVMGLLERGDGKRKHSRVHAEVLPNTNADARELVPRVRKYVLKGSEVHTDQHRGYASLVEEYVHKVVNHAECYVKDGVTTNGLENFWSLLKRTIKGTYVSVEAFHLFRYLSEQCFRFNSRKADNHDRFLDVMGHVFGRRLTYKALIGVLGTESGDGLPSHA